MPPLRRWVQFLSFAGGTVGIGALFVKYGTPSDEDFLQKLSPELKARYIKEREIRARADEIMQRRIEETKDKPAWLQGSGAMRKLDREIADEARLGYESQEQLQALEEQKKQLLELAAKEKRL